MRPGSGRRTRSRDAGPNAARARPPPRTKGPPRPTSSGPSVRLRAKARAWFCPAARYTTLLRAIELWRSVQADGPGRLAGDEEPPPGDGLVVCRKQDLSQQIKADPEDRLSTAFVGLDDDRPVFRLPFASRVGERKGYGQHSEKLADPVGVNEVGILEIEAARLGSREERFDLPPAPVMGQGALWIGVGGDYKQVSADQPHRSQFERRSKRAVA